MEKLRKVRIINLRMVAVFLVIARYNKQRGGTSSYEWPRNATGWDRPIVQQLLREMQYERVDVDGCSVGVKARNENRC